MIQPNKIFLGLEHKLDYYSQMLAEHPEDVLLVSNLRDDLRRELTEVVAAYSEAGDLTEEEKKLLEICNEILHPAVVRKGPLGFVSGMAGIVQEVARNMRRALHRDSDKDKVLQLLDESGRKLVPSYGSLMTHSLYTLKQLIVPDASEIISNLAAGTMYIRTFDDRLPAVSFCEPKNAALLALCSEYAYSGYVASNEVVSLKRRELPTELQDSEYDEHTGQLKPMNGFKIWVGRRGDDIIIAFAGTELSKVGSLLTDLQQLMAPNLMYLYAAGLVRLFVRHYRHDTIYVTGHSLGGGLAQFAVATNINESYDRLKGVGFNSAGLSMVSLEYLNEQKIEEALGSLVHYTTVSDPVSAVGALIGTHVVLPLSEGNGSGHSLASVRACLEVYVQQSGMNRFVSKGDELNEGTLLSVEARALPAPNYMGLPEARHIYVVGTSDRSKNWGCFGRGYSPNDRSELICSTRIYQEWILKFAHYSGSSSYQAGIANTVNGTCHTFANRILALSDDDAACVAHSIDDAYSVVVFGKYGSGRIQLANLLSSSFLEASREKKMPQSLLVKVQERVMNPYDDELKAWCYVVKKRFNLDLEQWFKEYPAGRLAVRALLMSYCIDRDALYVQCFDYTKGQAPTANQATVFRKGLADLVMLYVSVILDAMALGHIISDGQKSELIQTIKDYARGLL